MFKTVTFLLLFCVAPSWASTTVTMVHFSDYHSHALPFYSHGGSRGGVARLAGLLERYKGLGALVFNGGDMMNRGAPAWSDKYRCVEWAWLNGLVDAMALGNHDADYGIDELTRCRDSARYPLLSANTSGFQRYELFVRKGIRIGVFALAGTDFPSLIPHAGLTFADPVAAAGEVVRTLRDQERADVVVMIGHEHAEDDAKLAVAVPGIDVIFGSHSHLRRGLSRIPGTATWFLSADQYATDVAVVRLTMTRGNLAAVHGELVPVDSSVRTGRKLERRVRRMQRELERDPVYRDMFVPLARLPQAVERDELAQWTLTIMRETVHADIALSTASSFRQALPSGSLNWEALRAALPYDNAVVVVQLKGARLSELLSRAASDPSGDAYAFVTAPGPIDAERIYRVAVTDYMARVSAAYRDLFRDQKLAETAVRVRGALAKELQSRWPPTP